MILIIKIDPLICMMQGLTVKDMEELRDDIKMYLDLDRATPTRVQYWEVWSTTESHFAFEEIHAFKVIMHVWNFDPKNTYSMDHLVVPF
jgi:hypothetical protein